MNNADEGGVPLIVFVIVIFSAFLHASWNLATRAIKGDLAVVPKGLEDDVIESAEECPGECIMIEPD